MGRRRRKSPRVNLQETDETQPITFTSSSVNVMSEFFGKDLFLKEEFSDLTIEATNGLRKYKFPVHSFILKCRSSVFRCMLDSDFQEKESNKISISDFSAITVKQLLRYLYLEELPENVNDVCELLKLADKYDIPSLVTSCENILLRNIDLKNVCQLHQCACLFSLKSLHSRCLELIKKAAFKIINSEDFENFTQGMIEEIISASDLNVENESDVLWAIWRWSITEICAQGQPCISANFAEETKDLLKYVRWKLIDEKEFDKIFGGGVVLPEENEMINADVPREPLEQPSLIPLSDVINFCVAFEDYEERDVKLEAQNVKLISFMSDENVPLYITGAQLALYVPNSFGSIRLTFENCTTKKVVEAKRSDFKKSYGKNVFQKVKFEFSKPLKIQKKRNGDCHMVRHFKH